MTIPSTQRALHALRLLGVADTDVIARRSCCSVDDVTGVLEGATATGWTRRHDGALPGWALTPAGRAHVESLLAEEVDRAGARQHLESAYGRFEVLNDQALAVCSAWQVRVVDGVEVVNDHADPAHDRTVLARLGVVDRAAQSLIAELASALGRFGGYGPRLRHARDRVMDGAGEWFTRPSIDSYHTVWFEWHEDLLATLGRHRDDGRDGDERTSTRESA